MAHPAAPTDEPVGTPPALRVVRDDERAPVAEAPAESAPDVHVHTIECSPLFGHTQLQGRVVTDPEEIAAIRRRVQAEAAGRGAWRRRLRLVLRGGAR